MVLRAMKLVVQAALLLQVLHCTLSVNGRQDNTNFQNTKLISDDKLGTVAPADIPDSEDKNIEKQEERGFFGWLTGNDDDSTTAPPASGTTPASEADSGDLATTTPIPGTAARPSTSSFMSKFGSTLGEFTKSESGSAGDGSTAGAGSDATPPEATAQATTARKTKAPVTAAYSSASALAPGSSFKNTAAADVDMSGSESSASAPTTAKVKKPTTAVSSGTISETASESDDLADLLDSSAASGSDDLSDLLGSSTGSGSENALAALLGSGAGLRGSGSMPSFEEFMKEFGSMFGSGSSAVDLFGGDPNTPQNNTVNDDDIILGELYGGKEHGDAFFDIKNIKFSQMILNITVRGQERVDSIGPMVMTMIPQAVGNLVHGGKGGTEGFIEPEMGDTIKSVEVHWDKNKGKTCIFYIKMTTSGGKTIATGSKTDNSAVMKPPKGYQLSGFYGRSSSSAIFCIGAIWTKTTATDLAVTDVMAITSKGSSDLYNYKTTIRNWVGPLDTAGDNACYQKKFDASSQGMCPSGFNKDDDKCVTQCPLNYPIDCLMECIPQNSDCTQEIISKVASVVAVALNAATLGVFGTLVAAYKAANFALTCAINVVNAVKSVIYYLRYKQTTIPQTDTEKLMDRAFQLQIVILDLPLAICSCLGVKIPPKLQFSATILAVVSAIVMMAVMVGEAIFSSSDNVMLMLRESGALNTTALDSNTIELDTFLNSKNGTCGYEIKTLTNRVMGKVYEIRNNTPNAAANDVRVEVSKSPIITDDIPIVTNHCMGQIWTNKTSKSSYDTRNLLRKTLGVIIDQLIEDGTTDMGKSVTKKEKALEYSNMGLFILSVFDPTGIAWMASEFVQPICGPTEYLGEIDDGTLYDALGLTTVDQAFLGSYGVWKKKGDGSVTIYFESVDKFDVSVVIKSGGDKLKEVKVPANSNVTWTSTVEDMQDKTLVLGITLAAMKTDSRDYYGRRDRTDRRDRDRGDRRERDRDYDRRRGYSHQQPRVALAEATLTDIISELQHRDPYDKRDDYSDERQPSYSGDEESDRDDKSVDYDSQYDRHGDQDNSDNDDRHLATANDNERRAAADGTYARGDRRPPAGVAPEHGFDRGDRRGARDGRDGRDGRGNRDYRDNRSRQYGPCAACGGLSHSTHYCCRRCKLCMQVHDAGKCEAFQQLTTLLRSKVEKKDLSPELQNIVFGGHLK